MYGQERDRGALAVKLVLYSDLSKVENQVGTFESFVQHDVLLIVET
jgi:hypothetical protein